MVGAMRNSPSDVTYTDEGANPAMPAKVRNKAHVAAFALQLIAGTEQSPQKTPTLMLLGHPMTPGEVAARLQAIVDLRAEVEAARATLKAKLALEAARMPALRAFMAAYVASMTAAYGASPRCWRPSGSRRRRAQRSASTRSSPPWRRTGRRARRGTPWGRGRKRR